MKEVKEAPPKVEVPAKALEKAPAKPASPVKKPDPPAEKKVIDTVTQEVLPVQN